MVARRESITPQRGKYRTTLYPGGWSLSIRDCDTVRHFIVAISKEADALEAVIQVVPCAQLISSEPLPHDVLLSFSMSQGKLSERCVIAQDPDRLSKPVSQSDGLERDRL
jgi:hypothetical protein